MKFERGLARIGVLVGGVLRRVCFGGVEGWRDGGIVSCFSPGWRVMWRFVKREIIS